MQVLLMRHARAEDRSPDRYPNDGERPLTQEGAEEHRRLCAGLARMGIRVDDIVSSPLVRARQTAEIAAAAIGSRKHLAFDDVLGDAFSPGVVFARLQQFDADATILCVGHEPDMSGLAAAMLNRRGDLQIEFRKGAVLAVEFPGMPAPGGGTLLYFLRPKLLLKIL